MSFWMNNIGVELALIKPFLENRAGFKDVDTQQLFLALLFLHLCFFFGPAYAARSRGALNNPAVYFLLLVNRAFFGRLAIAPGEVVNPRILNRVALREQVPAIALSLGVLVLGLAPELLSNLSEAATTGLSLITGDLS